MFDMNHGSPTNMEEEYALSIMDARYNAITTWRSREGGECVGLGGFGEGLSDLRAFE